MTSETKHTIDLDDIRAYILVCECGTQVVLPADKRPAVPHLCPSCKGEWTRPHEPTEVDTLMAEIADVQKHKRKFALKLEISGTDAATQSN